MPPSSTSPAMSKTAQKSFEHFVRLALPRFDDTPSDRTYDFMLNYQDQLCNFAIHELYGVTSTSYEFISLTKE